MLTNLELPYWTVVPRWNDIPTHVLSLKMVVSRLQELKFCLVENVWWFHACKYGNIISNKGFSLKISDGFMLQNDETPYWTVNF